MKELSMFTSFIVKHFICDFILQRKYQYENKHIYGHLGGILHAGIHMLGTFFIVLYFVSSFKMGFCMALLDGVLHYHIDLAKSRLSIKHDLKSNNDWFWILLGIDQMLHYLTYIIIIALITTAYPKL